MSTGLLGSQNLAATTDTTVYTVPAGLNTTLKVFICNRNGSAVTVRLATGLTADTTVSTTNAIEWDVPVPANGIVERGNIILGPGEKIIARSNTANVSVVACGYSASV